MYVLYSLLVFLSFNVFPMNFGGGYLVIVCVSLCAIYCWLNIFALAVNEMCMRFYENEHYSVAL